MEISQIQTVWVSKITMDSWIMRSKVELKSGHKEELKRKTLLLCDSLAGPSWASVQVNGPWVSLRAHFWTQGGAEEES